MCCSTQQQQLLLDVLQVNRLSTAGCHHSLHSHGEVRTEQRAALPGSVVQQPCAVGQVQALLRNERGEGFLLFGLAFKKLS